MKKIFLMILFLFLILALGAEVVNSDRPQKGEWDFKLEKVWSIDRAGNDVFGEPLQVLVTDDGKVVVYDGKYQMNRLFSLDGQFVTSFGNSGEGPAEIRNQEWMYAVNGKVVMPDGGKIHYFNQDGTYDRSLKKPFGLNLACFLSEFECVAAPLTIFQMTGGRAKISFYNIKNGREKAIAEFKVFEGAVGTSGRQVYDVIVAGLSPLMIIGYGNGQLYYGMNNTYTVHVCNLEGEQKNEFSINRKKRKVTTYEKREHFKDSGMPDDAVKQIVDSLPGEIACFDRIEVHNGLIFVFVADLEHWKNVVRKPKQIDIFTPDGRYLYRSFLRFEKEHHLFHTPFSNVLIKGNHLYAVLEDSEGEVKLAKYKISLPRGKSE